MYKEHVARPTARYRFGVNYTPTRHWYYCWNDFEPDSIRRDLDAVAELQADHIRLQLIWPWFQPNPHWVSQAHLARLQAVMYIAAERGLDVCVAALDGWLSGFAFQPPYGGAEPFYSSAVFRDAQECYFTELAGVLQPLPNFLGFDLGNEINCCWSAPCAEGDVWMDWALELVEHLAPGRVHVNGVDHVPWFQESTFSPAVLARRPAMVAIHAWIEFTGARLRGGPLEATSVGLCAAMTTLAKAYAGDAAKPVWIQEFGATPFWMPAEIIPDFLEQSIRRAATAGATWFTWWCSHDLDRRLAFHPLENELGLITQEQQLKPHGRRFSELAVAMRRETPAAPALLATPPAGAHTAENTWRWIEETLR